MNRLEQTFLTEYSSDAAVAKYSSETAGRGISHLLDAEYGPIYRNAVKRQLQAPVGAGLRLLEFGCGAGVHLVHCTATFEREGPPVAAAFGMDFSRRLIAAAHDEVKTLPVSVRHKVKFLVARSETMDKELAADLNVHPTELHNSFHLVIGVNTFRYCCRAGTARDCAHAIYDLLKRGGVCVVIDMNNKFPLFRTRLRDRLTRPKEERYLPTLEQYAAPFAAVGFEVLERRTFCWIPHSAGAALLGACRALTPVLNAVAPSFAMRSLVIARKPL